MPNLWHSQVRTFVSSHRGRILTAAMATLATSAVGAEPVTLSHHGRLTTVEGVPVTTQMQLTMSLHPTATSAAVGWSQQFLVTPDAGLYAVQLGSDETNPLTDDHLAANHHLSVKIGEQELKPRLRLSSVPRAVVANRTDLAHNALRLGNKEADLYALKEDVAALSGASFTGAVTVPPPSGDGHAATKGYVDGALDSILNGTTFLGPVFVPTPLEDFHPATRQYVDALAASIHELSYARLTGAEFTGMVSVPFPTEDTHASTKKYVDDVASAIREGYARLTGASFIGAVSVPSPSQAMHAATMKYVDDQVQSVHNRGYAALAGASFTGAVTVPPPTLETHAATMKYVNDVGAKHALLTGASFSGAVSVPSPTLTTHAATKKYVDDETAKRASLTGANFSGAVSVPTPTLTMHAATKKYVDDQVRSDSRWNALPPAILSSTKIVPVHLKTVATGSREATVNGVSVLGVNWPNENGLGLIVLNRSHQVVQTNHYKVETSTGATSLRNALAALAGDSVVLLVGRGGIGTFYKNFHEELVKLGGVPMSSGIVHGEDLYLFAGAYGLKPGEAVEIVRHPDVGSISADFALADGIIIADHSIRRANKVVEHIRTTTRVDSSITNVPLDIGGPMLFYSKGRIVRIKLKGIVDARVEPGAKAHIAIIPNINGNRQAECDMFELAGPSSGVSRIKQQVTCEYSARLPPGPQSLTFSLDSATTPNAATWVEVLGGANRGIVSIEEIDG